MAVRALSSMEPDRSFLPLGTTTSNWQSLRLWTEKLKFHNEIPERGGDRSQVCFDSLVPVPIRCRYWGYSTLYQPLGQRIYLMMEDSVPNPQIVFLELALLAELPNWLCVATNARKTSPIVPLSSATKRFLGLGNMCRTIKSIEPAL